MLTGALAPWLQYIQKGLEWKRQVRFEAYTNRLNAMRECLKEVTQIYVMAEELREQTARAEPRSRLSGVVKEQAALAELRTQRIRQIAKIAGLIGYFPNSGTLVRRFEETATLLDTLARQTGEYLSVEARGDAPHPPDHGAIADTVTALRAHYRTLKNTMQEQVGRLEDEQDKIFF